MQALFFLSLFILFYTYVIYPIILFVVSKNEKIVLQNNIQAVTIIIPAFNEVNIINQKITNTKHLLQHHLHQIIVVSNGSTDGTETLEWEGVLHIKGLIREGKAAAINAALPFIKNEFVLLTDANTMLNEEAIIHLISGFNNPQVAMVCGQKKLLTPNNSLPIEKLYWNFESNLKLLESNFNTVIGAAGECILIKKQYLTHIPNNTIIDDFWLSAQILKQKLTIKYAANAIASEQETASIIDEYKRRVRIASGVMQWLMQNGLSSFLGFTNATKWQFFSHRFCRWILSPVSILVVVFSLIQLSSYNDNYAWVLIFSCIILIISIVSMFIKNANNFFNFPFYFIAVHICMLIGYCKYFTNNHTVLWHKANR